jgi:porin
MLAGTYQYQILEGEGRGDDEGGGAVVFQPELSFRPTDRDEFFVKLDFAADNAINDQTPFILSPWAADLEDDVQDINGRNRDYLLAAWYKHTFQLGPEHELGVSGGIIDATAYLEDTAFADDEFTQFMNAVLVNGPHSLKPSYDLGAVLEWRFNAVELRMVVMNVGANDDGNAYTFFGLQLAYTIDTPLGTGTYRLLGVATTEDFLNAVGTQQELLSGLTLSLDQELGEFLGIFVQLGWQSDDAAVDFEALYSGGVQISGALWRRSQDHIGLGYAYLDGGNTGIEHTHVVEFYVRIVLNDYVAFTADLQYMDEDVVGGNGPQGWIPGFRVTAAF